MNRNLHSGDAAQTDSPDDASYVLDITTACNMFGFDKRGYVTHLNTFIRLMEPSIKSLTVHLFACDLHSLRKTVHRIKGSAQYVQANELGHLSLKLELYLLHTPTAACGWTAVVQERIGHLAAAFDRIKELGLRI